MLQGSQSRKVLNIELGSFVQIRLSVSITMTVQLLWYDAVVDVGLDKVDGTGRAILRSVTVSMVHDLRHRLMSKGSKTG